MTNVLRILIAPLVWLAAFSAIYGLHGLLCGQNIAGAVFGLPLPRVLLVTAYFLAIVLQGALLVALYRSRFGAPSSLMRFVSHATGWAGLVITIWSLFPIVATSYCV